MKQYIDKAALVAEIKKRINFNEKLNAHSRLDECNAILSFLDTLEVKDIELEQETQRILDEHFFYPEEDDELKEIPKLARYIAKHFFELGLKSQKGE